MNTPSVNRKFTFKEAIATKEVIRKTFKCNPEATHEDLAAALNAAKVVHPNMSAWTRVAAGNFIYNHMRRTRSARKRRVSTRATVAPRQTRENDSLELATLILCAKIEKSDKERMLSVLFKAGA